MAEINFDKRSERGLRRRVRIQAREAVRAN